MAPSEDAFELMNPSDFIWQAAERAVVAGDVAALERLLRENEPLFRESEPRSSWLGGLSPDYSPLDARAIITREHRFKTWQDFEQHLEKVKAGCSPDAEFEEAVDAIVAGDLATLDRLLRATPGLISLRSPRDHRSTLFHYVGANGVESWRQRTPANAVQVAERLLEAGAEIDAIADMYGGSTTIGLVATSVHPLVAGVQNALLDCLLAHGAAIDHPGCAGNNQSIVNGCLANGRPGAAEYLTGRGARLDLEGAAGVGRLDEVKRFVKADGELISGATPYQLQSGLQWACEYDREAVVEYLLGCGVDAGGIHRGQTALHWAAYCGHPGIVRMLLARKVPVDARDKSWNGTPLGWALYGWTHPPAERKEVKDGRYHEVVEQLVAAGATIKRDQLPVEELRDDPRMSAALAPAIS
jgi:hypothetical protein